MKPIITTHADKRLRGRVGLPRKAHERHLKNVLNDGIPLQETRGQLNEHIHEVVRRYGYAVNNPLLYGHQLYLFDDNVLVTILKLPGRLTTHADEAQQNNG